MFSKSLLVPPICVPGGPPAPELPAAPPAFAPLEGPARPDAGVAPGLPEVEAASLQVTAGCEVVDHKTAVTCDCDACQSAKSCEAPETSATPRSRA